MDVFIFFTILQFIEKFPKLMISFIKVEIHVYNCREGL